MSKTRTSKARLQSAAFRRTRSDHSKELAEDYVELIAELIHAQGEARWTRITLFPDRELGGRVAVRDSMPTIVWRNTRRSSFGGRSHTALELGAATEGEGATEPLNSHHKSQLSAFRPSASALEARLRMGLSVS